MHGIGNDYIYMDSLGSPTSVDIPEEIYPELAGNVSDRHFGIGSDGLIMILPSKNADFFMRIFNADGSEAQMCGNGIRCVGKYVYEKGYTQKKILEIETLAGIKKLELNVKGNVVESVTVDMGVPFLKRKDIPVKGDAESTMISEGIQVGDKFFLITSVGMGNPHCVVFVEDVNDFDVEKYGRILENHDLWPEKTNVEFIHVVDNKHLDMRVWERGSGETLACGTGACAAAVASRINGYSEDEVEISLLGGKLSIRFDKKSNHVFMTGPASFIADGVYYFNLK